MNVDVNRSGVKATDGAKVESSSTVNVASLMIRLCEVCGVCVVSLDRELDGLLLTMMVMGYGDDVCVTYWKDWSSRCSQTVRFASRELMGSR